MTFEKEMDDFFMRNCYFEKDREKVKASLEYRRAAEMDDAIQAQEAATRILEERPLNP
ncbi:MAG TPA: hypothetical protein VKA67_08935 [Verrucomicrobiae bacterium]|nr:hypothetical protein [Verrucomicrobiae bacterium]